MEFVFLSEMYAEGSENVTVRAACLGTLTMTAMMVTEFGQRMFASAGCKPFLGWCDYSAERLSHQARHLSKQWMGGEGAPDRG